jgi:putative transposase
MRFLTRRRVVSRTRRRADRGEHARMPRALRNDIGQVPLHVIQRGNNRSACFLCPGDHERYLWILLLVARGAGCDVHAYVLMPNHVHLLVTPRAGGCASAMMQALGSRYVRYFNDRHVRTGSLWEGRFRSFAIHSERYFMECMRYIELNPVRAGIVADAADYRWISYRRNAFGTRDALVVEHPLYAALAADSSRQQAVYRQFVALGVAQDDLASLRAHVHSGQAMGPAPVAGDTMRVQVDARTGPVKEAYS